MGKTVMLKRAHASLEDEVAFLIEKINYLLRKVENYDRALNEFSEIKSTIEEVKENSRHSKDLVREAKEINATNSNDISTLVKLISTVAERFDSKFDYLKDKLFVLSDREINHKEDSDLKIESLREEITNDLHSYLTMADWEEISKEQLALEDSLNILKVNTEFNRMNLEKRVQDHKVMADLQGEKIMEMRKDLLRFQNALVRKGVPIDIQ